jgi:hypothetical protein
MGPSTEYFGKPKNSFKSLRIIEEKLIIWYNIGVHPFVPASGLDLK